MERGTLSPTFTRDSGYRFRGEQGRFEESIRDHLRAWTTDSFSFEGEHFTLQEMSVSPKPYRSRTSIRVRPPPRAFPDTGENGF